MTLQVSSNLAASLAPTLIEVCDERLGEIHWFKTDWQRGGAATGTSTYRCDDGDVIDVVVKLPVVQREYQWISRLQKGGSDEAERFDVVPRLLASGESLADYDLAWIVIEKFEHGPLGLQWHDDHVARIADAAARFWAAARRFDVNQNARVEPWAEMLEQAIASVRTNHIAEEKRWLAGLKSFKHSLNSIVEEWDARLCAEWLHGDLHFANAMSRDGLEAGEVSLIDLAEVHAGHWVEDAVYLERQLWARPDLLKQTKPVRTIAAARRKYGLAVERDYPRLAMIRRALLAATAPKFIRTEGSPRHLDACLNWLETALKDMKL